MAPRRLQGACDDGWRDRPVCCWLGATVCPPQIAGRSRHSMNERLALLLFLVGFLLLGLVLPLVRLYLRTGVFGFVIEKTPVQRVIGVCITLVILGVCAFGL